MPALPRLLPDVLLSVLALAREAGKPRLTTTELVKFAYLVDYFTAVETNGRPLTETPWEFLHFGPYHPTVTEAIVALAAKGWIFDRSGGGTSKDYILYELADHTSFTLLDDLGAPRNVRIEISQNIREFGGSLNSLLNFVYYHTTPMQFARPRQSLDFSICEKIPYKSLVPVEMKKIPADKLAAYRAKVAELRAKPRPKPIEWEGAYDEVYFGALIELEGPVPDADKQLTLHLE